MRCSPPIVGTTICGCYNSRRVLVYLTCLLLYIPAAVVHYVEHMLKTLAPKMYCELVASRRRPLCCAGAVWCCINSDRLAVYRLSLCPIMLLHTLFHMRACVYRVMCISCIYVACYMYKTLQTRCARRSRACILLLSTRVLHMGLVLLVVVVVASRVVASRVCLRLEYHDAIPVSWYR